MWLGCALLAGASAGSAQSVKVGIDAWSAGRHAEAVAIWRPLAGTGNADAAFNLGQAYKLGRGVPPDLAQSQRFYEQAARQGHVEAQTSLGLLLFQNGNRAGGLRWLKSAADAGEPRALLVYGTALFNGDGVPEDRIRAYAYVSRAAAQGLAAAKVTLGDMEQLIPLEERQQGVRLAQRLVAEGKPAAPAAAPASPAPVLSRPAAPVTARKTPAPAPAIVRSTTTGSFRVQLGAFRDRAAATSLYGRLAPRLGGAAMTLVPSGTMTRLQAGPYPTRAAASAACAALKPQPCFPVAAR
jgi:cell division septation protein DedD